MWLALLIGYMLPKITVWMIIGLISGIASGASYSELAYSKEDQADIKELLETLSTQDMFGLLKRRSSLNELGDRIEHVHPLKFLEIIVTDNHLKSCLQEVDSSFFKRSAFLRGLSKSFGKKAKLGEIDPYIPDFSLAVHRPTKSIEPFFRDKNWKGLVKYLLSA